MDFTMTWTSHRLPAFWRRVPDIVPPLPTDGSAEGDNNFFQVIVDSDEATQTFEDLSTRVPVLSGII